MRAFINAAKIRQAQSQRSSPSRDIISILNGGPEREKEEKLKKENDEKDKKELKRKKKISRMAFNNSERRDAWISQVQYDPSFTEQYLKGNIPMAHPDLYQFRDDKKYQTGFSFKGDDKVGKSKLVEYISQDYSGKQPHLVNNFRDKKNFMELSGLQFKYQPQTNEMRVQEQIKSSPPLQTEPLNTLLIQMPKWREYNKDKWSDLKDFNAQRTSKDKTWDPIENTSTKFSEPYIDKLIEFRPNFHKLKEAQKKDQEFSFDQKLETISSKQSSLKKKIFEPTVSADATWKQRLQQSISLRQRSHLNQSLKIKQPQQQEEAGYDYPIISLVVNDKDQSHLNEQDIIQQTSTPDTKVKEFFKFSQNINGSDNLPLQKQTSLKNKEQRVMTGQLSQILSESYNTPKNMPSSPMRSPIKVRKKIIDLSQIKPESAATMLNHDLNKSYTNGWQFQIIQPLQNKRFSTKVELNDQHILSELDKVKTYYTSLVGKLSVRSQISSPKSNFRQRNITGLAGEESEDYSPIVNPRKGRAAFRDIVNTPFSTGETLSKLPKRYAKSNATSPTSSLNKTSLGRTWLGRDQVNTSTQFGSSYYKDKSQILGATSIKDAIDKYFNKGQNKSPHKLQIQVQQSV